PTPLTQGRTNILLLGIDSSPNRAHALTDTMIVASLDPAGETVSMLSIPRDLVDVPLPNGKIYAPKINTLLSYVNRHRNHPDFAFAGGSGTRALQDAIGTLLGIEIHYYAKVNLPGFVRVIDAVGGVDVNVRRAFEDPRYRAYGVDGFSVEPGLQHFDGAHALAYARVRRARGETDFTRAARQQEVLVGLRDAALEGGAVELIGQLDGLLQAVKGAVRTDIPPERFSDLAFFAEEVGGDSVTRVVLRHPLVRPSRTPDPRGSIQIPDVPAIREVAADLFPEPGVSPQPWPSPEPSPSEGPGGEGTLDVSRGSPTTEP
ncbi:MAG: LCP family protein, partial [Chloroflexi bacterium]|nr:LCP family protein [Chloroflexota bacterium]